MTIWRRGSNVEGYRIAGHALARREGEEFDLVCVAVSSIAYTALYGLQEYLGIQLQRKRIKDGLMEVVLPQDLPEKTRLQADAILEAMLLGLTAVAESYPRHVKVETKEV